jgi:hypothetical protein
MAKGIVFIMKNWAKATSSKENVAGKERWKLFTLVGEI